MYIYELNDANIPLVSRLMAKIKPEFWDIDGATGQLKAGIGWYFGDSAGLPKGWLLCKILEVYKTVEVECLGYDDSGCFKIGSELQPLVEKSEEWARENGFKVMRFTIGSRGLSCHQRELGEPWRELRDIEVVDREEFNWFLAMGYEPSGIMPNIYGDRNHGIILIKTL